MTLSLKKFFFRRFRKFETHSHTLNYLFWECTTRCNLNCIHCGSDCSKNSSHPDMLIADFLRAVDTIKNPSRDFTVVFTGGEPLLRNDIELCGRELRKRGLRWAIVSNGMLYDEQRHISLLNAGMGALTLSLDGLAESHNWLRNSSSSFERVSQAINLAASSSRLNFDVVTCVNRRNIAELEQICDFLVEKGLKAWRLFTIIPIGRAAQNGELLLSDEEFVLLMDFIERKRRDGIIDLKFSCEGYVGRYEPTVRDNFFFCRAGINIGSVLIDGSIGACPNIDRSLVQGSIYTDNFFDVWQNRFVPLRNREWTKTGKCETCSQYVDCNGNGLHNWHGGMNEALVCHYNKIKRATCGHM